ncbi:PocR ligand-binding domain-containing protein [Oscillibacter sp.]|uniref:PocR ligand-binding domain-containing protein n=1 Tax=Oscillibacter sp. TaxID=1945593 RepID=UPI001B7218B5|nr:PocR ligand-binding domain-containing protein [Oscillibacter sp.]
MYNYAVIRSCKRPHGFSQYCSLIRSTEAGLVRCVGAGSTGRDFYNCHGGLYGFSTPVCLPNGTEIAYLLCGQVVDENCGRPDFCSAASACGVDETALQENYAGTRRRA